MSLSTRQQRRHQRRLQRLQRQTSRRRTASRPLRDRIRNGDLSGLDERQRLMAQAILRRRHRAQQLAESDQSQLEQSTSDPQSLDGIENSTEPNPA